MDDIRQTAIDRLQAYLERRQFSARHCQVNEKIPDKLVKYLTANLLTPCILVHGRQGKFQEIGCPPLS